MTVIGGAVLAALAHTVSPEKWTKYIKIVTGIMIISIILSPVAELTGSDIFADLSYSWEIDKNAQKKAVIKEMENKISDDIVLRIKEEFSQDITSEVILRVNKNYEIEGVEKITVWKAKNIQKIKNSLTEVYSPSKIIFQD